MLVLGVRDLLEDVRDVIAGLGLVFAPIALTGAMLLTIVWVFGCGDAP